MTSQSNYKVGLALNCCLLELISCIQWQINRLEHTEGLFVIQSSPSPIVLSRKINKGFRDFPGKRATVLIPPSQNTVILVGFLMRLCSILNAMGYNF